MRYEKIDCSIVNFFFILIVSSANAQENITLTADNTTLVVNVTNTSKIVRIQGYILNLTFMPPFEVNIPGLLSCKFHPFEAHTLAESKYKLECDFDVNLTTPNQVYVPLPITMLKDLEQIKIDEKSFAETKGMLLFFQLLTVVLVVVLMSYILYSEWWIYKVI